MIELQPQKVWVAGHGEASICHMFEHQHKSSFGWV